MNICKKCKSILVVELFVVLLFSSNAFAATVFYILPYDSNAKVGCEILEIKNNQALCTANNLLITYDIAQVKHLEVVRNGTLEYFQNFTQETIDRINELNSDKSAPKIIKEQEGNKKKY